MNENKPPMGWYILQRYTFVIAKSAWDWIDVREFGLVLLTLGQANILNRVLREQDYRVEPAEEEEE